MLHNHGNCRLCKSSRLNSGVIRTVAKNNVQIRYEREEIKKKLKIYGRKKLLEEEQEIKRKSYEDEVKAKADGSDMAMEDTSGFKIQKT